MMRLRLSIRYKGTRYCGWQVQPNGPTVQEEIQKAFRLILNQKVSVVGAGRTDSGVHALAQVAHGEIPPSENVARLQRSLNAVLPTDIAITSLKKVPGSFHAQLSARRKVYSYFILNQRYNDPFLKDYVWHIPVALDVAAMRRAAKVLIGRHDFAAFCARDSGAKTTVRRIHRLAVSAIIPRAHSLPVIPAFMRTAIFPVIPGDPRSGASRDPALLTITIAGNGFLKHMVRTIVGTLVDVGRNKKTVTDVRRILRSKDRKKAGRNAPPGGLFLTRVIY